MKRVVLLKTDKSKLYWSFFKLLVMVGLPIFLLIMPANFFDKGESICLSKLIFNFECYACGMTRACMHLIHLDVAGANYYNAISFVVLPIICILWLREALKERKKIKLLIQRIKLQHSADKSLTT